MRAVNLLTPELRSAQKGSGTPRASVMESSGGLGAFVLIGALALCVAAVAGYVLTGNVIKERQASLAAVSTKNDETVKRAAELKPYADFQTVTEARASTVQALASARFDWEQTLRDLSRALPSNVYLSALKGDVGAALGRLLGLRSSIASPALELSGCTRSQPAVAALMSRLRNIQGVTRVSLSKSEKADAVASARSRPGRAARARRRASSSSSSSRRPTVGTALADATGDRRARRRRRRPPTRPAKPPPTRAPRPTPTPAAPREARPRDPQKHDRAHRGGRRRRGRAPTGCSSSRPSARRPPRSARRSPRSRPSSPRPRPRWPPTSRPAAPTRPTTRWSRGSARPSRPTTTCAR